MAFSFDPVLFGIGSCQPSLFNCAAGDGTHDNGLRENHAPLVILVLHVLEAQLPPIALATDHLVHDPISRAHPISAHGVQLEHFFRPNTPSAAYLTKALPRGDPMCAFMRQLVERGEGRIGGVGVRDDPCLEVSETEEGTRYIQPCSLERNKGQLE